MLIHPVLTELSWFQKEQSIATKKYWWEFYNCPEKEKVGFLLLYINHLPLDPQVNFTRLFFV